MNIIKGPRAMPVRAVIYAIAGFGKTSLAAGIPGALFIDVEGSSERYDVARIDAKKLVEILAALRDVSKNSKDLQSQGFRSIIIDTADWVQAAIEDFMCRDQNKASIAECAGGFGKGYVEAGRQFSQILELCDTLVFNGFNVVFLAHSAVKKVSPPGELQTYDRFILGMDEKNFATPLYEWAEMVLFGKFEADVVAQKGDKRIKATDRAQTRMLYTSDATAWFAKNRFSLPREIAVPTVEIGADGKIPVGILPRELAAVFAGRIQRAAPVAAPAPVAPVPAPAAPAAFPWPASVREWIETNESLVTAYLVSKNRIQIGDHWSSMSADRAEAIVLHFEKFKEAVTALAK